MWFYIYIYDTAAELQRAAKKYRPVDVMDWDGTVGCFHPNLQLDIDKNGKTVGADSFIGVMRLCREAMTELVIIHESTHAAINYVNILKAQSGYMVGNSNIVTEEALCHAVGEFSASILRKAGLIHG
jgi:hypothetical protein